MNKEQLKDIIKRALKTFIQTFLALLLYSLKDADLTNLNVLKTAVIGALAGGISAVMNFAYNLIPKNEDTLASGDLDE